MPQAFAAVNAAVLSRSRVGALPARGGAASCRRRGVSAEVKRFVYVLQSVSQPDRQFVESTANVPARVASHNAGHSPLTASCRPWRLVTVVQFGTETSALRFEKFLKTGAGRALARQFFVRQQTP